MIADPKIREENKLRLVMLYALRYEKSSNNAIQHLVELLQRQGISDHKTTVSLLDYSIPLDRLLTRAISADCCSTRFYWR
jgi:hypothetical protein